MSEAATTYSLHNSLWERIRIHNSVVTAAVFAPKPDLVFKMLADDRNQLSPVRTVTSSNMKRYVLMAVQCFALVGKSRGRHLRPALCGTRSSRRASWHPRPK